MKKNKNTESSRKAENMRENNNNNKKKWSKSDLADKKFFILCFKMEIKLIYKGYSYKTAV